MWATGVVPKGRKKQSILSFAPTGAIRAFCDRSPTDKSVGYFRMSLQDKDVAHLDALRDQNLASFFWNRGKQRILVCRSIARDLGKFCCQNIWKRVLCDAPVGGGKMSGSRLIWCHAEARRQQRFSQDGIPRYGSVATEILRPDKSLSPRLCNFASLR